MLGHQATVPSLHEMESACAELSSVPGRVAVALALESLLYPAEHAIDRSFGTVQLRTDFTGGITLQRQRHYVAVAPFQAARQFLNRLGQHGHFRRRRLTGQGFPAAARIVGRGLECDLGADPAAIRLKMCAPSTAF